MPQWNITMGCCESCLKFAGNSSGNSTESQHPYTFIADENETNSPVLTPEIKSKYFQSIIDDAQRKFINTSFRQSSGIEDVDGVRANLSKVSVDEQLLVSPPTYSNIVELTSRHRISELLGDIVLVSPQIEMVSDEVAEIVISNSFQVVRVDDSNSAFVSLKPVVGTLALIS